MVATDFTNLVGSVEQDYAAIPAFKDTLTAHLSASSAQADMTLHTMAVLQVYQAHSLKEMDEGGGLKWSKSSNGGVGGCWAPSLAKKDFLFDPLISKSG